MIPAGGCCINDTVTHIATNYLPLVVLVKVVWAHIMEKLDSIHLLTIRVC